MNCTICDKPLHDFEVRLGVTAHFPCVCSLAFGPNDDDATTGAHAELDD